VVDSASNVITKSCGVNVFNAVTMSCPTNVAGVGALYSSSVGGSGGSSNGPTTVNIVSGNLPPPMTITSQGSIPSNTPSTAGNFSFTLFGKDPGTGSVTISCFILVTSAVRRVVFFA
jgi:hypothetical protein